MDSNLFLKEICERGITRLCHFTRSIKVLHILRSEDGIKAVDFIEDDIYDANDELRLDGKTNFVNCSIQYPNYWYWKQVKDKNPLFKDWVILYINPTILLLETTEFCFTNAAFKNGVCIKKGYDSFKELFANTVHGKRIQRRTPNMLHCCPTDDQAEVLVYKNISRKDIIGVAVESKEQAKREYRRWYKTLNDIPKLDIIIAPDLFNKQWSNKVRQGKVPLEFKYQEVSYDVKSRKS
jgi:hypothetical protein